METAIIQTTIRLPKELTERIKRQARREHRSFNSFVEHTLERSTEPLFPQLKPEDFVISEEIENLAGSVPSRSFSARELTEDPKLAYLADKYGL